MRTRGVPIIIDIHLALLLRLLVFAIAALAGADSALEGFLVDDAFIGQSLEDGFVFLAFTLLGFGFAGGGAGGAVFARDVGGGSWFGAVAGEGRGTAEVLP